MPRPKGASFTASHFRKHRQPLTTIADLTGQPIPVSWFRLGGMLVTIVLPRPTGREDNTQPQLERLRIRLSSTLQDFLVSKRLTPVQVATAAKWLRRPALGLSGLAREEHISKQAAASRLQAIVRRWPEFARAWELKKSFIDREHTREGGTSEAVL